MDDPWGSPWADEAHLQTHHQPASTTSHEVRPAAPVKATALALQEKTNSPWNDEEEDSFGGWAAVPAEEPQFGLKGVDGGWERGSTDGAGFVNNDPNLVSIPWGYDDPLEKKAYPSLGPSPSPKPTDDAQQPRPDPCSADSSQTWNRMHTDLEDLENEAQDRKAKAGEVEDICAKKNASPVSQEIQSEAKGSVEPSTTAELSSTAKVASGEWSTPEGNPPVPQDVLQTPDIDLLSSSRPSSSPSDHSHHNDVFQESPRTSLDEEPNRPHASRKVSTKIKGLVKHFDSLAKPNVDAPITNRTMSVEGQMVVEQECRELENDDDFGDFGDFEDVQSDLDDSITQTPTSQARLAVMEDHKTTSQISSEILVNPRQPGIVSGPVKFDIDTDELVKLFPIAEEETTAEEVYISDVIPIDSFSSAGERKMWYRLSRYGPMRKHNSGNDENYIRTKWSQSQVRTDTLKIVARWLEEDRISGRVVLGGGSKGSSIFGWNDTRASPVLLADAFASQNGEKRGHKQAQSVIEVPREWPKGLVRDRSASNPRSPSKARRRSSVKSPSITDVSKVAAPDADLSWNTPTNTIQSSIETLLPGTKRLSMVPNDNTSAAQANGPRQSSSQLTNHVVKSISTSPEPQPITTTTIPSSSQTSHQRLNLNSLDVTTTMQRPVISKHKDDEDDWGELVSSANTPTLPSLASNSLKLPQLESLESSAILQASTLSAETTSNQQSVTNLETTLSSQISSGAVNELRTSSLPATLNGSEEISAAQQDSMPSIPPIQNTTVVQDPWASADFSFFDAPSVPAPSPTTSKITKTVPTKSVKFSTPTQLEPRKLYKTREQVEIDDIVHKIKPSKQHKSREEVEQDGIVRSIVEKLPNISYMLKR